MGDAKQKKDKVAVFDVTKVDSLKRKRLVSLAKQAGLKANQGNDQLKEALKTYHKDNKSKIDQEIKERKAYVSIRFLFFQFTIVSIATISQRLISHRQKI